MGTFDAQSDWAGFVKAAIDNIIPFTVHWDLTWRCDHKCVHCYLTDRRKAELDMKKVLGYSTSSSKPVLCRFCSVVVTPF